MEIYIANIRTLTDEQVVSEKCGLLSNERKTRIQRLQNSEDRKRSAGAGFLLEYGLRRRGYTLHENVPGKSMVHIEKGGYGKPYLADAKGVHFNLSHSGDYVAAVFASCEAGIDVERIRTARLAVAHRFFTKEEYECLDEIRLEYGEGDRLDEAFAGLWTRKESYIKAVGEGMHLPLTDFCALSDEVISKNGTYRFQTWVLAEEYALSVCAKGSIQAEPVYVDLMKII